MDTETYPGEAAEIAHDERIRATLHGTAAHLKNAAGECSSAERHLRELVEGAAWYEEFAGTTEGADALAELADAMRSLRNVERIVERHLARFTRPDGGR